MTHNELQESLASHLRANQERMVWTDTQLGPSGSPRPDVFTVAYSFSRPARDAYEVKVSMSDLRRDTTSGKWQQYLEFAHRVWFAFPKGLASLELVPRECGVILRDPVTGNWRAARKPIAQVQKTMPPDAWLKLVQTRHQTGGAPMPRRSDDWYLTSQARKKFGDEVADLLESRRLANYRYENATKAREALTATIEAENAKARESARKAQEYQMARLDEQERKLAQALGLTDYGKVTRDELIEGVAQLAAALGRFSFDGVAERLATVGKMVAAHRDENHQSRRQPKPAANDDSTLELLP